MISRNELSVLSVLLTGAAVTLPAQAADVDKIVDKANRVAYYPGTDGRAEVRLTIDDGKGRTRVRQFTILRRDHADGGDQDYLVLFSRPADVRKTVFLVAKHVGRDDDRWLYLPGLDLVRRIAAGDKRTSFVGSHFFYEDVSGRDLKEDKHELVETTKDAFVVRSTPRDAKSVEFASWKAWIDKKSHLPRKMEYVDGAGKVYRRIEALTVEDIKGHPTVTKMKVSDLRSGGHTLAEFRNIDYDIGVTEEVFAERSLRNPPRKWFRSR